MGRIKLETHNDNIIGMDHILDLIKHSQHKEMEIFSNSMLEHCSFACITRPTRLTKNMPTLLYNVFVNGRLHN